ncbi:hypothetical protein TKK_0002013 [Trichogramma kaykai]|uniref:Peptidase S1 domain-containing protein n=1 Tax=Trichogramma kaykai TaxID=54128 RepID=A0ABD2X929_9HYME
MKRLMKQSTLLFCVILGASIGLCYSGGAQSRIANLGETAQRGELPHHVDIFVNKSHHCGAALISARHVLTAAHCLYLFFDPHVDNRLEVIVGTVELGEGASYGIRRIAYPAEFDPKTVANDIAVVHLKRPVILSANVKPVSLPRNKFDEPNVYDSMIIAGYGWDKNNIDADYLKVLQTQVVSPEWCSRFFKIEFTRFCTYRSRDYGVCPGDSGSPLVNEAKTIVYGIASEAAKDCANGKPEVYTKVSQYLDFIRSEMNYYTIFPFAPGPNPSIVY